MSAHPIHGTRYDDVVQAALDAAEAGDYRARHISIGPRGRVITPHRDEHGHLDRDDLAAQIYATAHDLTSTTGSYASGCFVSGSEGFYITAPDKD